MFSLFCERIGYLEIENLEPNAYDNIVEIIAA
jgi:hypothetical protein